MGGSLKVVTDQTGRFFGGLYGHVRECDQFRWYGQADVEGGLQGRLVPARETPTGVRRLELRHRCVLILSLFVCVLAPVETLHFIVYFTREDQIEGVQSD